ncbi:helix-turn-helix domain-containing protein [Roseomonas marmotae]|uniref:helix-turn-helix domain-containing protein n=1 Tax=Roseomonas marmotae TaxID=2768161 RepID=UPI0038D09CCF
MERAFRVLEAFGRQPHPMSLSQRAEVPGLDKSSAQGVSYTLTRLGCIERDDGVRYFIPAN